MEKRYHSIVKIVFVAATHNCMYINRGGHVDHPTKTNDQTNKSKFFRGFIVQILIIFTVSIPYFFQLNPRGLVFLEGLKSGLYWNEGYIRMRVAVY